MKLEAYEEPKYYTLVEVLQAYKAYLATLPQDEVIWYPYIPLQT